MQTLELQTGFGLELSLQSLMYTSVKLPGLAPTSTTSLTTMEPLMNFTARSKIWCQGTLTPRQTTLLNLLSTIQAYSFQV